MEKEFCLLHPMRRMKEKLSQEEGSQFLELAFAILLLMIILVLFLTFFPVVTRAMTVNSMAHEMARYIEIRGEVTASTEEEFLRIRNASGIHNARMQVSQTGRIGLQEPFEVIITSSAKIEIGSIFSIPVTMVGKATGRGENYWK